MNDVLSRFLSRISNKFLYFGIAGMIGALLGGLIGEMPFLLTKQAGIELSESILETQKRVQDAGGKTGNVQISLKWDNRNDLDLHVIDPANEEIYFSHKRSVSGGELDVDRNVSGETITPIENIVWVGNPLEGNYKIYVKFYNKHDTILSNHFTVVVNNAGVIHEFDGDVNDVNAKNFVHEFTYSPDMPKEGMSSNLIVGLWGTFISMGIALLLVLSQRKLLKQSFFSRKEIVIASIGGAIAGLIAGILANSLFVLALPRNLAWGIMGLLLGITLTKVVPNLKIKSGIIGGVIGGMLGGLLFTLLSDVLGEILGRMIGAMMIGFFIGMMISLLEGLLREAWLVIEWDSKEKAHISLGKTPIILGSSLEAHVRIPNAAPIVAIIFFEKGVIKFEDKLNNTISMLRNNSNVKYDNVNITIKSK